MMFFPRKSLVIASLHAILSCLSTRGLAPATKVLVVN